MEWEERVDSRKAEREGRGWRECVGCAFGWREMIGS